MKKLIIDCEKKTQKYIKLTEGEVSEMKERQRDHVEPEIVETLEEKIERIVQEIIQKRNK